MNDLLRSKPSVVRPFIMSSGTVISLVLIAIGLLGIPNSHNGTGAAQLKHASDIAVFVSTAGDDSNPGTIEKPVRSLEHARDMVRSINGDMSDDIHVYFRQGTYVLSKTFTLDDRDSGSNGFDVVYEAYDGENVVISGGRSISVWEQVTADLIRTNVEKLDTRQLFVNGKRAVRARSEKTLLADVYKVPEDTKGFITTNPDMQNWQNQDEIEFVYRSKLFWPEHRCGVEKIEGRTIVMQQPCFSLAQILGRKNPINAMRVPTFIENAFELLDEPGEWYLDKQTGWLYYYPLPSESIGEIEVVAPELELLVHGKGRDSKSPIHNVQFKNLQFSYATWLGVNDHGFPNFQSVAYFTSEDGDTEMMHAGVIFERAEDILIEHNTFNSLGGSGISFMAGPKRITVRNNTFTDISGTAIQLGDHNNRVPEPRELKVEDNEISSNRIHDVGVEYASSVGIFVAFAENTLIEHNELFDIPHCGISIGWSWNTEPTAAKNNKIRYNFIHDYLGVNGDCGGIYSLGNQPGSEYSYNVVMNQKNRVGGGIYMDAGSAGVKVHHNVLFNNQGSAIFSPLGLYEVHHNWWQDRGVIENSDFLNNDERPDIYIAYCDKEKWGANHCKKPAVKIYDNVTINSLDEVPKQILDNAGLNGVSCDGDRFCKSVDKPQACKTDCRQCGNMVCESGEFHDTCPQDCALNHSRGDFLNEAESLRVEETNVSSIQSYLKAGDPLKACRPYCANMRESRYEQ